MKSIDELTRIAKQVRWNILRSTSKAGSGHPTSSLSSVELMVCLLFGGVFRADLNRPKNPGNDRLIFSKGHAAPLLYSLYAAAGKVTARELLTLRRFGSRFEGHPAQAFRYTEFPTGSLGQGLSVAVGIALAAQLNHVRNRTYVLLGDGEMAEGAIWEAIQFAGFRKLDRLVALLDVNRLGQSGPTMLGHHVDVYAKRISSFGWKTIIVPGHDVKAILAAYQQALAAKGKPTMIIAKTVKGKGVPFLENKEGWHGRTLDLPELKRALKELGQVERNIRGTVAAAPRTSLHALPKRSVLPAKYAMGTLVAPRQAVGRGLVRLAPAFPNLVVLDAEVKNSTFTELFEKKRPARFIETYIAEQNMAGIASGLSTQGELPVVATFSAFLTRTFDQLRMLQYSDVHAVYVGTHPGVHIGEDGASQMGLEDIAMFRTLGGSTVLYPADAMATERLLELALHAKGTVYIRATRGAVPVIYDVASKFRIGGSNVIRASAHDRATVVAAGITLFEAMKAAEFLAKRKVNVRVIDLYSIKPLDVAALKKAAIQTQHLVVAEDHRSEGGIAEAVRSSLGPLAGCVTSLAVRKTPRSGKPEQLLTFEGIDAQAISATIRKLL